MMPANHSLARCAKVVTEVDALVRHTNSAIHHAITALVSLPHAQICAVRCFVASRSADEEARCA
jgi:hypothetical protein